MRMATSDRSGSRIGWGLLALSLLALLGAAAPARAQLGQDLQCEDLVASSGPDTIITCSGAEGLHSADGVAHAGDWIELNLVLLSRFCFVDSLRSECYAGHSAHVALEFLLQRGAAAGLADTTIVDSLITPPGDGFDCESYHWAASSRPICLSAGSYHVRIVLANTGKIRLDCLHLTEQNTPVAVTTWGQVKATYQRR